MISDEAEKPADLSQKIVFKVKRKEKPDEAPEKDSGEKSSIRPENNQKSKRKKGNPKKIILSFQEEEDEG